ncbi:MAG: TonB-dependent receptor [Verrucomicrobia bacterium]|nr:TonB-dependent receptor [Verrucomicrobiota bacterium]
MNTSTRPAGHHWMAGFRTMALAVVLFFGLAVQSGFAQGSITGRVTNAATGKPLEGARVELRGTGKTVLAESDGEYHFTDVAPGTVTLSVSYTGLNTADETVTVNSGTSTRHDVGLTADIYRLSKFVVSGEREGNAEAITMQKQSNGVKNVLSTDAFGSLAGNPADLLMRLPGVEAESVGGDRRYVRIRGLHQALSTVTMDGSRVGSGGGASGGGRDYEFNPVGSDTIERIEVVKSPTPDMAADSIGGAVNFVSKNAFNHGLERRISGSIGAIWRATDPRDEAHRNYSISYSEVFGGRFGVAFNYAQRKHGTIIDIASQGYGNIPNGTSDPRLTSSFSTEDFRNYRTGWGGGFRVDYKLSENSRFYVNQTMNKYREYANHRSFAFSTPATLVVLDPAGRPTGTGAIIPGYTSNMTQWFPVDYLNAAGNRVAPNTLTGTSRTEYRRDQAFNTQAAGIHRYRGLEIDWTASRSKSKAHYPGNKTFNVYTQGFGLKIERQEEPYFPVITQTGGADITKISSYTRNQYDVLIRSGWDQMTGSSLDVKKLFTTPVPSYIKAGFRWRDQQRDVAVNTIRMFYVGPDGVMGVNPATGLNDDNLAQFVDDGYTAPGTRLSRYPAIPRPMIPGRDTPGSTYGKTGFNVETALKASPQLFAPDIVYNTIQPLIGETHFTEGIYAPYIMGNVDIGKLRVMGGVRVETTKVWASGPLQQLTLAERARRLAYVGPVTTAQGVPAVPGSLAESERRVRAEYANRQEVDGEYRKIFPGLHFKYQPTPNIVTRLSYATNIGRPSIGQLIPTTTVNLPGVANEFALGSISTSNPNLKPQTADNFDLAGEYYFEPVGLVSVGLFLKEIKSFIYTRSGAVVGAGPDNGFDGQYEGYTLTTQANGGYAKIKGVEFNYSQQFTFLPGWWSGFGAFANYTRMQVVGNYSTGGAINTGIVAGSPLAPTSEVAGFNPETANAGISYIKNRLSVRAAWNHNGRYLTGFSLTRSALTYSRARDVVDIKTTYQFSKKLGVYLDAVNIFAEADRASEAFDGQPRAIHKMGPMFFFGLNTRL